MKTAISLPDKLFHDADALAVQLGKSRSQLYREAIEAYVTQRGGDAVTEALNAVADELGAEHAGFGAQAARAALERSEW
jgi:predicted transcriptional regulator